MTLSLAPPLIDEVWSFDQYVGAVLERAEHVAGTSAPEIYRYGEATIELTV